MKRGKDKLTKSSTFMDFLKKRISKREFLSNAKSVDHKQEKLVGGDLYSLTYFLIDSLSAKQLTAVCISDRIGVSSVFWLQVAV